MLVARPFAACWQFPAQRMFRRILGNICRLHVSTRASVGSCRVEKYTSGQDQSIFFMVECPKWRLVGTVPTCDVDLVGLRRT
jgi:hypothetical protein